MHTTMSALLSGHDGSAPAIGAPDRAWLTYDGLRNLTDTVKAALHGMGIGKGDRVAIVLPNGPEMATAFVTIAQVATTAPLNPAYREEEYDFYLSDLKAKALVVMDGYDGPAVAAATKAGMAIVRVCVPDGAPAGLFELESDATGTADSSDPAADDVALILHTSGTTSRPKIVPLLQSNVAASAEHIKVSLDLTPADRCLNVMPLFHIHGLIAAVTASLAAGASIWCAPGFDALRFFSFMKEAKPTWYTAVPTMHQAILSRASRNADVIAANPLRFLRSSSASLPAQVMVALNETFNAPVVEAYGMTEAAHQMACNPLESGTQKPGAVGIPAGPEMRIAHETEDRLIDGTGEVAISGPNVTPGYESNPEANAKNFFEAEGKRWFRTGDQGAFDDEGYLHLTGRLKEIINRGGEKISPLEVDGVLLDHPDVAQVVTFALPHPKLGEEVAAALVLKEGSTATEKDIRAFASERMADFKVPRKVIILDEIPKGATGKMQRIGLAEKLGLVEKA
ncbi:acyl--CoA ligase [Yoonia sediminilitoris]|uniref:Acyl-CoA synthetase (AMP-forming)/AMP-acid ligase II n=1 Tax=Yoonia sediminilitoris TaxID=1286148 RepID=A0A2T6KHG0_9RHOB|nr:acyl--CoA ligase [Yoonia sediminilitoris]PUB14956.1 acyl-CoA synthetase (AMP-forming)/AMP-acid ligase II [Yoonia sediminilitoris]RCW95672.1 acyl-CoA synthetase (AMP-forming)/AMP-acid ligase II [Yoonia sediminilitoris]